MVNPVALVSSKDPRLSATITDDGELLTTETEREENVCSRYAATAVGATLYVVMVDLSDMANFHLTANGRVDISAITVGIDRAANSVGAVNIGVVTRVDATNGDISFFSGTTFVNVSDTSLYRSINLAPSQMKCGVRSGIPTRFVTNDKLTNSTAIQSDVALNSPLGDATVFPAVGDIVAQFLYTSGTAYNATVRLFYHGEQTA